MACKKIANIKLDIFISNIYQQNIDTKLKSQ